MTFRRPSVIDLEAERLTAAKRALDQAKASGDVEAVARETETVRVITEHLQALRRGSQVRRNARRGRWA
jgi:hypothetical protein